MVYLFRISTFLIIYLFSTERSFAFLATGNYRHILAISNHSVGTLNSDADFIQEAKNNGFQIIAINEIYENHNFERGDLEYIIKMKLQTNLAIGQAVAYFKSTGLFRVVEEDNFGRGAGLQADTTFMPNDKLVERQWYIYNDGSFPVDLAKTNADIDLDMAWKITQGDSSIIVAILDSGIKLNHPEFKGRLWKNPKETTDLSDSDRNGYVDDINGWNFVTDNNVVSDDNGHGTFITGVLAANGNNMIGYAGIDWKCKLMICKVLDEDLNGYYSNWIKAIYYAVDNGAKVINMSFGGKEQSNALADAVDYAYQKNVVLVSSMQNDNKEKVYYPAAYNKVIAVGSSDPDDARSTTFINSASGGSNYGSHLDVVAPGNYIYGLSLNNTNYGSVYGGTSIATPIVSGIASLILANEKNLPAKDVYAKIYQSCDDLVGLTEEDTPGWDKYYGYGRVNAFRALTVSPTSPAGAPLVFPTPTSDKFTISYALEGYSDLEIRIIDLNGHEIYFSEHRNIKNLEEVISLGHFSSGIYFLTINSNFKTSVAKIVLTK